MHIYSSQITARPTAVTVYVYAIYIPYERLLGHLPAITKLYNFEFPSRWSLITKTLHSPFTLRLSSRSITRGRLSLSSLDGKDHSVLVAFSVSLCDWRPTHIYSNMETEVHVYTSIAMAMGVIWRGMQRCTPKTGFHELHIHVLCMHTQVQFCANELACPCSQSIMHCPHTYNIKYVHICRCAI